MGGSKAMLATLGAAMVGGAALVLALLAGALVAPLPSNLVNPWTRANGEADTGEWETW
jgi:hypothetical protein